MKTIILPLSLALVLLGGAGCEAPVDYSPQAQQEQINLDYPALYTEANLPQYPGARVTNRGVQEVSLEEQIKLKLRSQDSVEEIKAYYEEEMTALGWEQIDGEYDSGSGFYITRFHKDDLRFLVTLEDQGDSRSISLVYYLLTENNTEE